MAEIKSTLELVMERTRHLTMTEEDKREQTLGEFRRNLGGLIQKVQDGVLGLEGFKADLSALQDRLQVKETSMVVEELAFRLNLDGENDWLLNLLAGAAGVNTDELAALFRDYRQVLALLFETRTGELKRSLFERHGISGSAVIPNHTVDPEWTTAGERLRERFTLALERAVAAMKAPDGA